jgi:hypothetical protein
MNNQELQLVSEILKDVVAIGIIFASPYAFKLYKLAKEKAEKVIKDIIDKSKEYYNQYKNMPKTEDTAWDYKNTIEPLFSTIKGTTGTIINSIYLKIFYLLDAEEKEDRPQYSLEAIQIIAK